MPIDDTIPDSGSDEGEGEEEEYYSEEEEEQDQKRARYASAGPPSKGTRVYGGGQPIVPPSPAGVGGKKKGIGNKIIGGIKKLF